MADLDFYKLSMTGAEADSGIRTGMEAGATNGVLLGDGDGGVSAATPGRDFGFPLLTGNGPPTGNTAANIGQHYFDMRATKAPYEYICVGISSNGFIWIVFGDTGDGFKISGYFASLEALEAAISAGTVAAPTAGAAYGIGEAAPYDIYVWDATNSTWVNNGPLGGGGGSGVPPHGTTGQALVKLSDVDHDAGWGQVGTAGIEAGAVTLSKIASSALDSTPTQGSNNLVTSGGVAGAMANSNFLDNSDFTQFVAQAGIGGQHGTQAYAGDRWILDSGSVTGTANANGNGYSGITLNGTIRQVLANPPATGTPVINMVSGTATISYAGGEVTITSAGGVIKNAGLYEGTYAEGSKPKYRPKGYGAELAECILYFRVLQSMSNVAYGLQAADAWLTSFALSPPMRVTPSLAHSGANIMSSGSGWQAAPLGLYRPKPNGFVLTIAHSGIVGGGTYVVSIDALWLSADLE